MECHLGTLCLRIRVANARSLKDKRQVHPFAEGQAQGSAQHRARGSVRAKDSRQDCIVVATTVANSRTGARMTLDSVHEEAISTLGRDLTDAEFDFFPL